MLDSFGRNFLALGPPLILLGGTVATVAAAVLLRGAGRWWALAAGPGLSLVAAAGGVFLVIALIEPGEQSGFLLGGVAIALYVVALAGYYPILAVVRFWRAEARGRGEGPGAP